LGIGAALHVVHPIGFSMDAKTVRRAGLDYWKHVDLHEHQNEDAFWHWVGDRPVHLFSKHGTRTFNQFPFASGDVLLFGRETLGLPSELVASRGAYRIPMTGPTRSLNLSNAVAIVAYEALRAVRPALFSDEAAG